MAEFRQTRFEILPPVIKNLIIINALIFLAQSVLGSDVETKMFNLFALHAWQSPLFKPWQFFTYLFLHGSIGHIFFNMYALWMFGSVLENLWGPKRFLIFYFVCGLGAALCHMTVLYIEMSKLLNDYEYLRQHFNFGNFENFYVKHHISDYVNSGNFNSLINEWRENVNNPVAAQNAYAISNQFVNVKLSEPTLGASGAIFGCLAAFGYLFPNSLMYIIFIPVPLKAKWLVLGYIGIEIFLALKNSAGDEVAHVAHLGGAVFGLALVYFWNKTNRRTLY